MFQGCYRDMKKRHMDAMALVTTYGKPDVFLTMTCNPNWPEIHDELFPGQTAQVRPDLVARVFRAKLETMKDMLTKEHIIGVVKAYVYVVEFQKRGLPHAHFLLIMDSRYKLVVPEQYDRVISAELPDKHKYPRTLRHGREAYDAWPMRCAEAQERVHARREVQVQVPSGVQQDHRTGK
jgi:hypothetical protein